MWWTTKKYFVLGEELWSGQQSSCTSHEADKLTCMHLNSLVYCHVHEAWIVFALVAHSVLCLRLSQYFLFLKNTETTVFSICFGVMYQMVWGFESQRIYLGFVVPPGWGWNRGAWEFWKRKCLEMKNRKSDGRGKLWRKVLVITLSYLFSLMVLNVKARSHKVGFFQFLFVCFAISEFKCVTLKSENYTYILFL